MITRLASFAASILLHLGLFLSGTSLLEELPEKDTQNVILPSSFIITDLDQVRAAEEAQAKEAQAKEAQAKEAQAKEAQAKEAQAKDAQAKDAQAKEAQAKEAQAKEAQVKEAQVKEAQVKEAQVKEAQVKEAQVKEAQVKEAQVKEAQAKEAQAKEAQAKEAQAKEAQAKEAQAKEAQAKEAQAKDAQAKDAQAKEAQAKEAQAKEAQAKEAQVKEAQVKEAQVKEAQVKEAQVKEAQAKEAQAKEAQAKEAQAKEAQAKEAQAKEAQAKEAQAKEAQAKEAQAKEAQAKEAQAKEAQAKEAQAKEAQAKEAVRAALAQTASGNNSQSDKKDDKIKILDTIPSTPDAQSDAISTAIQSEIIRQQFSEQKRQQTAKKVQQQKLEQRRQAFLAAKKRDTEVARQQQQKRQQIIAAQRRQQQAQQRRAQQRQAARQQRQQHQARRNDEIKEFLAKRDYSAGLATPPQNSANSSPLAALPQKTPPKQTRVVTNQTPISKKTQQDTAIAELQAMQRKLLTTRNATVQGAKNTALAEQGLSDTIPVLSRDIIPNNKAITDIQILQKDLGKRSEPIKEPVFKPTPKAETKVASNNKSKSEDKAIDELQAMLDKVSKKKPQKPAKTNEIVQQPKAATPKTQPVQQQVTKTTAQLAAEKRAKSDADLLAIQQALAARKTRQTGNQNSTITPSQNIGEVITNPAVVQRVKPNYPVSARRRNQQGTTIIRAEINRVGLVTSANVQQSSGHAVLDKSALKAVKKWIFQPVLRNGQPANATVDAPVTFSLHQ